MTPRTRQGNLCIKAENDDIHFSLIGKRQAGQVRGATGRQAGLQRRKSFSLEPVQASPPPGRKENGAARSHTGRDGDELRFTSACRVGTFPDWKFRLPGPGCRLIPKRGLKIVSKDETEVRARFPARTAFPDDQSHSEIKHRPGSTGSQEAHKPSLLPPLGSCSSLVDKLPHL